MVSSESENDDYAYSSGEEGDDNSNYAIDDDDRMEVSMSNEKSMTDTKTGSSSQPTPHSSDTAATSYTTDNPNAAPMNNVFRGTLPKFCFSLAL
jgi:hypothetical protein